MQLSPSDPTALNHYAWDLLVVGRTQEALGLMERLLRVAPFDRFYRGIRVRNLAWARQYERALEELERVRKLDPSWVEFEEVTSYAQLGRLEQAHRAHLALYERCGPPCTWMKEALERGWSEGGWSASLRALAQAAEEKPGYSPFMVAVWHSWLGETEKALSWLERAERERDPLVVLVTCHPAFDPVRSDPRYADLIRRIGFPET